MSYWTDWFVAEEEDAERIACDEPTDLPRLILDGVIQTDLDELADILDAEYIVDMEILIVDPMVIAVPNSFVAALAALKGERVTEIAERWGTVGEMGGHSSENRRRLVESMRHFSSQSLEAGKRIIERAA